MQFNLRRFGYYALAALIAATCFMSLGILAFVFLPVLIIATIPLGLYLIFCASGRVWNDSNYVRATEPIAVRNPKGYKLIHPKQLITNYKSYHLN